LLRARKRERKKEEGKVLDRERKREREKKGIPSRSLSFFSCIIISSPLVFTWS